MDSGSVASPTRPRVAVIGAGVAGLVAARRLASQATVTLYEAGPRAGGQVRTVAFADRWVDVGAEALHAVPPVLDLVDELGLTDRVVRANEGQTRIWDGRRLRRLPAGVGPAGPTRLGPVLSSRSLSLKGLGRAALEPFMPRSPIDTDLGVGTYLSRRFGAEVVERLVDPVLGSLHAGDVDRLSIEATAPQLAAIARDHRSLLLAHRARRQQQRLGGGAPAFLSFGHGLQTFVDRLQADTTIALEATITAIRPTGRGFLVMGAPGADPTVVDAVVLATSAPIAARLLEHAVPDVAWHLAQTVARTASVATVVAAYRRDEVAGVAALAAKGLLVSSASGRLLKGATFLTTKWPHLDHPDLMLVRLSAGRAGDTRLSQIDDNELVTELHADLADAIGLKAQPVSSHVERWTDTMAQLEVGHVTRVETARHAIAEHPLVGQGQLALAGASYDGLGVAACVRSGENAAATVVDAARANRALALGQIIANDTALKVGAQGAGA